MVTGASIPDVYKYNTAKVREQVVRGLFYIRRRNKIDGIYKCNIKTAQLRNDIKFLLKSLGYSYFIGDYFVKITKIKSVGIRYISHLGKRMGKCVTVDAYNGMFLATNFIPTHNSFCMASRMLRDYMIGPTLDLTTNNEIAVTAYSDSYLTNGGIIDKVRYAYNQLRKTSKSTGSPQFPFDEIRTANSEMRYELDSPINNGLTGIVAGFSTDKARGRRNVFIGVDEFGNFLNSLQFLDTARANLEIDRQVIGMLSATGTGGTRGANFFGALELINNPTSRNFYGIPNVYDRGATGQARTVFFYPTFLCAADHYNENGVTDIVSSMLNVLYERYKIKYNSSDPQALTAYMAEYPFTIQEAIIKKDTTIFPVSLINDRVLEIDNDNTIISGMYIGKLVHTGSEVKFEPDSSLNPVMQFPHKDNKLKGAVYISEMPQKDSTGKVP
jgi:hypothetical protein